MYLDHPAYGVTLLATVLAGGAMALHSATVVELDEGLDVRTGEWAHQAELALDESFLLEAPSRKAWTTVEFGLTGRGLKGVLVGDEGWLFTDEEFRQLPDAEGARERKLVLIERVRDELAKQGVELVVALVPAKARMEAEHLGRYRFPSYNEPVYEDFRRRVEALDVLAPDLRSEQLSFCRTDTHWDPAGAREAARTLAVAIREEHPRPEFGSVPWTRESSFFEHEGDLLRYLPLWTPLAPERIEQFGPPVEVRPPGLFDEVHTSVLMVGSSYTAQTQWGFADSLAEALEIRVVNAAEEGGGPVVPMLELLSKDTLAQVDPDIVVWELPERFLGVRYTLEGPLAEDLPE